MSLWTPKRCAVFGSTGGIGAAFVNALIARDGVETVYGLSRSGAGPEHAKFVRKSFDYDQLESIVEAASTIAADGPLDLVLVATGFLHNDDFGPEKSLRELDAERLARVFHTNTIGPALVAKSFLPLLAKEGKTVFAALSARVGSISDNRVGGWYGYRGAKAALNQILKTASIEHGRRWKDSVVIGLHPGTVDTGLSQPFQRNVAEGRLFEPNYSATAMLDVIDKATPEDTGKVFAYDGSEVPA